MEEEIVHELYVMAVNSDELVLVRVQGDIDRLVARAFEEHPFDISEQLSRR